MQISFDVKERVQIRFEDSDGMSSEHPSSDGATLDKGKGVIACVVFTKTEEEEGEEEKENDNNSEAGEVRWQLATSSDKKCN